MCAGLIVLVKLQLLEFQFPNPNQHSSTGTSAQNEAATGHAQFPNVRAYAKQTRRGSRDAVLLANLLTGNTGRYRWAGTS